MGSSLPAKAGVFAVAATLSGLLALGVAPLAGAAESSGNSGSTPAADNANYGASATAPNSPNANTDHPDAPAYGQTGTTPADANANGGNRASAPAAPQSQGPGGQAVEGNGSQGQGTSQSTSGQGNTPPGNNTTIKIHRPGTAPDDNRNEPHISCEDFLVDFYGYDAGNQSTTMTFQLWAPTRGGSWTLDTSNAYGKDLTWTTGTRTTGNQPDHEIRFSPADVLSNTNSASVQPAKQGYHVRLTVHVTGSQGADVKHKVFWIAPCTQGSTEQQTAEQTVTTGSAFVGGESFTTGSPSATAASETGAAVLGAHFAQQGSPAVVAANAPQHSPAAVQVMGVHYSRSALATTGAAIATLLGLGGALLAAGWALTRASRRRSAA